MSFICYQSIFVTVVHGYFNGMMIEGGARWGYDPVWEGDDDIIPVVDSEKATAQACESKREKRHFILEQHLQS